MREIRPWNLRPCCLLPAYAACTGVDHVCLGPHPEVESIDLDGMCVYLCDVDGPETDPAALATCADAGGACVVLTGGLLACIPTPDGG